MALTTWAAFVAAHPEKANSCTQTLLVAKGVSANEMYLIEVNPATGQIPVDAAISAAVLGFGDPAAATRGAAQIGNATGAALFGAGAVGAQVLRTTPASDSPHLLATRHEASATPIAVRVSNGTTFNSGKTKADGPWSNDYAGTAVTTAAYLQIVASSAAAINRLNIFDSSGQIMVLAIGAGGAEVDQFYIPPGGIDIDYYIAAGSRIALKAVSGNATVGMIVINALT